MFWSIRLYRWYYIKGEWDVYVTMKLLLATVTIWICVVNIVRLNSATEVVQQGAPSDTDQHGTGSEDREIQEAEVEKITGGKSQSKVTTDQSKSSEKLPLDKEEKEDVNSKSDSGNPEDTKEHVTEKVDSGPPSDETDTSNKEGQVSPDQPQEAVPHTTEHERMKGDEHEHGKREQIRVVTDRGSSVSDDKLEQLGKPPVTEATEPADVVGDASGAQHVDVEDKDVESLKSGSVVSSPPPESDSPATSEQDVVVKQDSTQGGHPAPQDGDSPLPSETQEPGRDRGDAPEAAEAAPPAPGSSQDSSTGVKPETTEAEPPKSAEDAEADQKDVSDENLQPPNVVDNGAKSDADVSGGDGGAGTDTEETGSKPHAEEEVIQVPENTEDKLPSFDEWKQKMLAEQAEQEKSKTMEVQSPQTNGALGTKMKGSKKVNYASATCGAKVRATNTEAQNPSFILSENKDQYMINPCKAKKWFTVELCTPVQIQALEIGNLELFSSLPESFIVQISEGYPTKDWKPLGTFHARDERSVQSFSVEGDQMYAHYIKVEMVSHFGSEHYCPLTVLRVYGLTVIEADEETEESAGGETDEMELNEAENEDSTLFHSATDTVLSLVKKVLNHGEEEGSEGAADSDSLQKLADAEAVNASTASNATKEPRGGEHKEMEPCIPDARPSAGEHGKQKVKPEGDFLPKPPDITNKPLPEGKQEDKVEDDRIVTLIQTPGVALWDTVAKCQFCSRQKTISCAFDTQTICGYYRLWHFAYPACCLGFHEEPVKPSKPDDIAPSSEVKTSRPDSSGPAASDSMSEAVNITPTPVVKDLPVSDPSQDAPKDFSVLPTSQPLAAEKQMPSSTVNIEASTVLSVDMVGSDTETPSLSSVIDVTNSVQAQTTVAIGTPDGSTTSLPDSCSKMDQKTPSPGCQVGPDVAQVRPTSTVAMDTETQGGTASDPITANEQQDQIQSPTGTIPDSTSSGEETKPEKSDEDPVTAPSDGNGLKNFYAEEPASGDAEAEPEMAPVQGEDMQYQKLISGRKETTFMKLKNRIKDLELNLNLSSQYLEELSQRYRRQMEEMYSSLNKTITKLANTSRKAEDRDMRQQEYITSLQGQINQLNSSIELLKITMADATMQVIERHLYLMLLEACIFLAVLAWCLQRQEKNLHNRGQRSSERSTVSTPVGKSHSITRLRRNSIDATPPRDRSSSSSALVVRKSFDDCDIRKSGSENDLSHMVPDTLRSTSLTGQWEISKKKKKKKNIPSQKSLQFGHLVGQSHTKTAHLSSSQSYPSFSVDFSKAPTSSAHGSTARKVQTQGCSSGKEPTSKDSTGHRRNGSSGPIRGLPSDQVTSHAKGARSLGHRKCPSFDRNMYNVLPINGNSKDYKRKDGVACNGHTNEYGSSSHPNWLNGRYDGKKMI